MPLPARCLQLAYDLLLHLLLPAILLRLWWRGRRAPDYRARIGERFARYGGGRRDAPVAVWVHAVSAGEVIAVVPLLRRLTARYGDGAVLVTTMTPTGAAEVRRRFGDSVEHRYLPYDFAWAQRRFQRRFAPRLGIFVETELWPNALRVAAACGVPLALVNARLSARSYRRYFPWRFWIATVLGRFRLVAAQFPAHAIRFAVLGARRERLRVTGSIKFDLAVPEDIAVRVATYRRLLGTGTERTDATTPARFCWLAASTHEGEEAAALEAHARLLEQAPEALLVLVPRHPERFGEVARLAASRSLRTQRLGEIVGDRPLAADPGASPRLDSGTQVLVIDRMGELFAACGAAAAVFVGGSLVERGGHNVIEPAWHGAPVLTGPSDRNFREIVERYERADALLRVRDAAGLAGVLCRLEAAPQFREALGERARRVTADERGALTRLWSELQPLLP